MFSFWKYFSSLFETFDNNAIVHANSILLVLALFAIHFAIFLFRVIRNNYPIFLFIFGKIKKEIRKSYKTLKYIFKKKTSSKRYALIEKKLFPQKNVTKSFLKQKNIVFADFIRNDDATIFKNYTEELWSDTIIIKIGKFFVKRYTNVINNRLFSTKFFIHPFRGGFRNKINSMSEFYNSSKLTSNNIRFYLSTFNKKGLAYIYTSLESWLIPIISVYATFFYLMVDRCLPFNKTMFVWFVITMFGYWLISGFVYFIKKYQFSKFTSAIQRFWRRSYILFWLIEFSLFSVFFYLTLNANNESWYMYDQLQVNKTGVFSWRIFVIKIFPLTLLLVLGYLLLLGLKWNIFNKHVLWLLILTNVLLYVVWSEFYQFFHAVNFYGNFNWIFDADEKVWSLELESRKSRTVNHYVMLMIMLKFWHIVVIFIIWVFFVLRVLEIGRIRYPLFSANLQNFLILYLFAWVMMFPWLKFILRKYLDMPYYWFYINNREIGLRIFFSDLAIYYYGLLNFFHYSFFNLNEIFTDRFFFFSLEDVFTFSKKTFTNNLIISNLFFK